MVKRSEKGFTLIELMIVVAIIGILAAVAIPKFADLIDRSKEAKTKGNLSAIRSAISIYYGSNEGLAPGNNLGTNLYEGLVTDGENMSKVPGADVPFVDNPVADGSKDASYEWVDNADTKTYAYGSKGSSNLSTNGYAYDASELEVWIELMAADSGGNSIHDW